ncbi:MAG: response regulator transcription factor [Acidimicrobiia bacterium]
MIHVLIADDHQLFAEGLAEALTALPDIEVAGTVGNGQELITMLEERPVDVVLIDLEMPVMGGLEALAVLPGGHRSIVVTMHASPDQREHARRVGATAFFSKATPLIELAAAVRAVAAGERLIELAAGDMQAALDRHSSPNLDPVAALLTHREKEILQLLAEGVSSTEDLAEALYISHKTVKNHLANIFAKLAVSDRTQAVVEAIRLGVVRPK